MFNWWREVLPYIGASRSSPSFRPSRLTNLDRRRLLRSPVADSPPTLEQNSRRAGPPFNAPNVPALPGCGKTSPQNHPPVLGGVDKSWELYGDPVTAAAP